MVGQTAGGIADAKTKVKEVGQLQMAMKMGSEKEWAKEKAVHKYSSFAFVMSRVGVLVLVLVSVISIRFFLPRVDTLNVIAILAIGMILGAIYVRSQEKIEESYVRKLEEIEKKDTEPQ